MLLVAYDFTDNDTRYRFSKFLKKFGRRIQYSVFEIKNSKRILDNIVTEVEAKYKKSFQNTDSVIIFRVCEACKKNVLKYGYAKNEDKDIIFM